MYQSIFNQNVLDATGTIFTNLTQNKLIYANSSQNLASVLTGPSLSFNAPLLDTIQDIRTSATPTFNSLILSNPLAVSSGGTSHSSYVQGDILYCSSINILSKLPIGAAGQILTSSAGVPSWQNPAVYSFSAGNNIQITGGSLNFTISTVTNPSFTSLSLTTALGVSSGGTSHSSYTQGDLLYSSAANTLSKLPIGANNTFLSSNGSVPVWQSLASFGVSSIQGTANQVLVNGLTTPQSGSCVLSLPQDIATSSTPSFGGQTLSGALSNSLFTISGSTTISGAVTTSAICEDIRPTIFSANTLPTGVQATRYSSAILDNASTALSINISADYYIKNTFKTTTGSTITRACGIYIDQPTYTFRGAGFGTLQYSYGLYVKTPAIGTNSAAIYADSIKIGGGDVTGIASNGTISCSSSITAGTTITSSGQGTFSNINLSGFTYTNSIFYAAQQYFSVWNVAGATTVGTSFKLVRCGHIVTLTLANWTYPLTVNSIPYIGLNPAGWAPPVNIAFPIIASHNNAYQSCTLLINTNMTIYMYGPNYAGNLNQVVGGIAFPGQCNVTWSVF